MTDHHREFEAHRGRLFGIAYRMTGSVRDAEDTCQDAWLRWSAVDPGSVENPEAFLVSVVTRLCLDRQRAAATRRESYVGPWVPEPLVGGGSAAGGAVAAATAAPDPEAAAEMADSLTLAFLVLMDRLSPAERAAFLLHDVFGYSFDEVAEALGRTPAACRQLASRARRTVRDDHVPIRHGLGAAEEAVIASLLTAIATGDVEATMAHLAPDVVQLDDGGPKVRAGRRPIVGPGRVARLWVNLARRRPPGTEVRFAVVNGGPGVELLVGGRVTMVVEIGIGEDGLVHRITAQLNPDKLSHLGT
jgi:RNA polymerase sigma-70 factor (ECF subfamily)